MRPAAAFVLVMVWQAAVIQAQDCTASIQQLQSNVLNLQSSVDLVIRQNLEFAINNRVKETFDPVQDSDGSFMCASTTPASSLPLGNVAGVPDGVSGPARCALYCRNFFGCTSFNYLKTPLNDGTQCQLFTVAPNACTKSTGNTCQHFQAAGNTASCRSTADFKFLPATQTYYKPIFESLTWAEASDRCKQLSPFAHLAVFRSMAEFNELTSYLKTIPATQAAACSTNVGFGADWSGYWIAKRKLTNDAANFDACKSATPAWALDSQLTKLLPEQAWESSMWLGGMPDCSQYWRKAYTYEMCMAIPVYHLYQLNDMMCDYKQCAVCQLD